MIRGKIYKITSPNTEQVYIGSTTDSISYRLYGHGCQYISYRRGKNHYCSSYEIIERGNAEIELIEEYICNTKEELRIREQYWIENTPNNCNKRFAHATEGRKQTIYAKRLVTKPCACGGKYSEAGKRTHFKTKLHQQYLQQ